MLAAPPRELPLVLTACGELSLVLGAPPRELSLVLVTGEGAGGCPWCWRCTALAAARPPLPTLLWLPQWWPWGRKQGNVCFRRSRVRYAWKGPARHMPGEVRSKTASRRRL